MGALVSRALRPIKSFNIENRAHRIISKEKPTPAPRYPSNIKDLKEALKTEPDLDEKLDVKDPSLDARLKDVYVTSHGRPEDDVTREKLQKKATKLLPQDRKQVEDYDFGFKEPEKVKYGCTTIRHAIEFISAHQSNPEEVTAAKIALEYKMREEDVQDILKYFKTYDVYLPATNKTPAIFAGPAALRKQLQKHKVNEIDDVKKDKDAESSGQDLSKIKVQNKS